MTDVGYDRLPLQVAGVELTIATARRGGSGAPVVCLHGFGSTKEDYVAFAGRPLLAYDAPGCGESECSNLSRISLPFLVETAEAVLAAAAIDSFHLIGHSLGGLTALLLACRHPGRVLSLIDIEGNLAPEDCFLSRQILTHPAATPEGFVEGLADRTRRGGDPSGALYAASLPHKVRAAAVRPIFESMVELSDGGGLLERFLGLPCPRLFVHGEQSASLSYLPQLEASGVEVASLPASGHWPMYANPVALWERIDGFLEGCRIPASSGVGPGRRSIHEKE